MSLTLLPDPGTLFFLLGSLACLQLDMLCLVDIHLKLVFLLIEMEEEWMGLGRRETGEELGEKRGGETAVRL